MTISPKAGYTAEERSMETASGQPKLGQNAIDFDLQGTDGRRYRLADISGANGTLVMFICNHCPYVKAAIGRTVADVRELQKPALGQ